MIEAKDDPMENSIESSIEGSMEDSIEDYPCFFCIIGYS